MEGIRKIVKKNSITVIIPKNTIFPPNKDLKKYLPASEEDVKLSLLWIKDEVMLSKQMKKLGKRSWGSSMYSRIARGLREAYRTKRLKLV